MPKSCTSVLSKIVGATVGPQEVLEASNGRNSLTLIKAIEGKLRFNFPVNIPGFILRNALRNRRRFTLTVFSVAVSLFLLTSLQVVLRGMTDPATTEDAALRIVVRHKVSLANMLYSGYKPKIQRLPGVEHCTKLIWFGGIYQDEKNFFPQFACDAADLFKVLREAKIDPQQRDRFIQERTACVAGITLTNLSPMFSVATPLSAKTASKA